MIVDQLARKLSLRFVRRSSYHIAQKENEWVIIKPMLYMNNSGIVISKYLQSNVDNKFFIVVCDDSALPLGKLRIREKGSDGGHQGLASIIYHLQTSNFPRLRVGIGYKPPEVSITDYVLSKFTKDEKTALEQIIETVCQAVMTIKESGIKKAMTIYNALSLVNNE